MERDWQALRMRRVASPWKECHQAGTRSCSGAAATIRPVSRSRSRKTPRGRLCCGSHFRWPARSRQKGTASFILRRADRSRWPDRSALRTIFTLGFQPCAESRRGRELRLRNDTGHIGLGSPGKLIRRARLLAHSSGFSLAAVQNEPLAGVGPCGHGGHLGSMDHLLVPSGPKGRIGFGLLGCVNVRREASVRKRHRTACHASRRGAWPGKPRGGSRRDDPIVSSIFSR